MEPAEWWLCSLTVVSELSLFTFLFWRVKMSENKMSKNWWDNCAGSSHLCGVTSAGGGGNSFLLVCVAVSCSLDLGGDYGGCVMAICGENDWFNQDEETLLFRSTCRPSVISALLLKLIFQKTNQQPFYQLRTSVRKRCNKAIGFILNV